ncbi:MAG: cell division protein ZapA [Bacteroidetes bacterium]|nr:cell division protein ZapA [Bacteroidota bacterium]
MKIDAEEEERVRKAAKMVNEKMMEFKDTYAADKQDLLAMSALTFAIEASKNKENVVTEDQDFIDKLNEIENIVDSALKK